MTSLETRERARSIIVANSMDRATPIYGARVYRWAQSVLAAPLGFNTVVQAVQDAEARYELGMTDFSVAETVDRIFRGEGVTVDYQTKMVGSSAEYHRAKIDGKWSPFTISSFSIQVGNVQVSVRRGSINIHRIVLMDLSEFHEIPTNTVDT